MELLRLSKLKLQLRSLVSEARDLRERERSANEQLHLLHQKQKKTEEECGRRIQELQSELAASDEIRRKLEWKISHLQDENAFLENQQKELNATIQGLVHSRDDFIHAYEESTCEMMRAVETRDRKLAMLVEKINSHLLLFYSIEKEALSVKQIVDDVKLVVSEKEELASSLRSKVEKVCSFESLFTATIHHLQKKIKEDDGELKRKDRVISELEAQIKASTINNNYENRIEELQRILTAKDEAIQNLLTEKEGLLFELGSLASVLQKVYDTFTNMNEEEKIKFAPTLGNQKGMSLADDEGNRDPSEENHIQLVHEAYQNENCMKEAEMNSGNVKPCPLSQKRIDLEPESSPSPKQNLVSNIFQEKNIALCSSQSPSQSVCLEPSSAGHDPQSISVNDGKESSVFPQQPDSECSTTQTEIDRS